MTAAHLKTPMNPALNRFADGKVADGIQLQGKTLPCSIVRVISAGIVEVKFEVLSDFTLPQMVIPVAQSQFVRLPYHVGMKGVAVAASVRVSALAGLGGGVASLNLPGNLSALIFVPLGSTDWAASVDPQAVEIVAPNGAIIHDSEDTATLTVSPDAIELDYDGTSAITIDSGGISLDSELVGFYGTTPVPQPTVTGLLSAVTDANAKAVLISLIAALAGEGLFVDGTT